MKRLVPRKLYGLKGNSIEPQFNIFKADFFAKAIQVAINSSAAVTTALTLSGATTTGILVSGTATNAISITGVNSGACINFGAAAITTASLLNYTGITGKISGYLFNGSLTTSILTASTLLDDCSCSCAHDGVGADTLRMIRRIWSGALPNGTLAANFVIAEYQFSGTAGTDQTKTGAVTGVKIDLGSATLNDDNLTAYGLYVDTTVTNTKSAAVHGIYITSAEYGVSIGGACVTGISITGTHDRGLGIGISGAAIAYTTVTDQAITVYNTCNTQSAGTEFEPVRFNTVLTGSGQIGGRVRVHMETNVTLGNYANAFKASTDLKSAGGVTGLISAVCAELVAAAKAQSGTQAVLEVEMVTVGSATFSANCSLIYSNISGNGSANSSFLRNGNIWRFDGLGAADTDPDIFHTNGGQATSHGLRINIGGVAYDILLSVSTYASILLLFVFSGLL